MRVRATALVLTIVAATALAAPAPAPAVNLIKPVCGVLGWFSGIAGKACTVAQHGDRLLKAGGKLLTGHLGGAAKALAGAASSASPATGVELAAIGAWVLVGARASLEETAKVITQTTRPNLSSTWFSATYWRMAGLAALLTLPFLFAAAAQAVMRSDLSLLVRAAFGYLPLAMLAVSVAAPLTMLLLAASDEMSALVSAAAGNGGVRFLRLAGGLTGAVALASPFLAFLVGLLTAAGAVVLWLELLMRQAAVYVVVLMLPMMFAAMVWPARRVWAVRTTELLVALILSKFAIVAVLALAGAALGRLGADGASGMLTGMVLVTLGAFTPWALLRLLPLAELASGAAGSLRGEFGRLRATADAADTRGGQAADWAGSVTAGMRSQAEEAAAGQPSSRDGAGDELGKLATPAGTRDGAVESAASVAADGVAAEGPTLGDAGGSGADEPVAPEPESAWQPTYQPGHVMVLDEGWPQGPLMIPNLGGGAGGSASPKGSGGSDPRPPDAPPPAGSPGAGGNPGPTPDPGAEDHDPRPPRQGLEDGLP